MGSANRLKLGLFGANCSSGRAVTAVPERWSGSWPDCVRLAQMADRAGIEFMLPIGRWKGYGGDTDYQGATWETVAWACGLLAKTERLTVFGTVHAPLIPPLIAAKEFVTADHIGEGRFGLNVVCGWNEGEFEMFGATLRDHEARYAYAQEWLDVVKLAWSPREDFDFDGQFIKLKGVRAKPKPYGGTRPLIMNAGASATGQAFAIRNCDALFSTISRGVSVEETASHISSVRALARKAGREIDVYTVGVVTCRPTAREAQDYYRHAVIDNADWAAVDNILAMRNVTPQMHSPQEFQRIRDHQANGMGGLPLVGDPDSTRAAADALYEERLALAAKGDANDSVWAIEAIMDYDPEPGLDKITAKVLLINAEEDEANPPELGTVERAMKRVCHGRYVLIPASEKTHGHFTHFYAEIWKPYLIEFMKTLGASLQAAAE